MKISSPTQLLIGEYLVDDYFVVECLVWGVCAQELISRSFSLLIYGNALGNGLLSLV